MGWEKLYFPPSYIYKDFAHGIAVSTQNNEAIYGEINETFRAMCRLAKKYENEEDSSFFLIIDEINRPDVGMVFLDLLYQLTENDDDIRKMLKKMVINMEEKYESDKVNQQLSKLWFVDAMRVVDERCTYGIQQHELVCCGEEDDFLAVGRSSKLRMPKNLYIIGTMGGVDKSMGLEYTISEKKLGC